MRMTVDQDSKVLKVQTTLQRHFSFNLSLALFAVAILSFLSQCGPQQLTRATNYFVLFQPVKRTSFPTALLKVLRTFLPQKPSLDSSSQLSGPPQFPWPKMIPVSLEIGCANRLTSGVGETSLAA